MTFVPIRLAGDRITLKDGSHWTITEQFGRTGIDDYYAVENGERSRFVYADEIASPAPIMRGLQSIGRALRPVPPTPQVLDHAGAEAEWKRRFDAARVKRGDNPFARTTGPSVDELIEGGFLRPYQARAFAALDPETTGFDDDGRVNFIPGIGKIHYIACDYDAAAMRRMMDDELSAPPITVEIIDRDEERGK